MSEQKYNIIFRGDILFGHQLSDVKLRLQQLFKSDESKINGLFSGRPVPLKRNVDLVTAKKYCDVLENAGAQVQVVAADEVSETTKSDAQGATNFQVSSSSMEQISPQIASSFTQDADGDWELAPAGSDLLRASEKNAFVARDIDTSALQLRPVGGDLMDVNEKRAWPVEGIQVPNLELAVFGENLIRDEEKEIVLPKLASELNVDLAPAGADLGQIKLQVKTVTPNIAGMHLVD